MTMYKKGTHDSSVVISSSIYSCSSCNYTEMAQGGSDQGKKCPKCDVEMTLISSHAETETFDDSSHIGTEVEDSKDSKDSKDSDNA